MMMRSLLALVVALAVLGPGVATADTLATTTGDAPLSAWDGWVVWSEPADGGWHLVALHDGLRQKLAVRSRASPFDVDLGTDARGRVVATFTRCKTYPAWPFPVMPGTGCRIRIVDLTTGRERAAGVPLTRGVSDATPSMWQGRLAFSRLDRRHGYIMQIKMWPGHGRLVRLPHGPVPTRCPNGKGRCHGIVLGTAMFLDLGPKLLTYSWFTDAPSVAGHGGTVVLSMSPRGAHRHTMGSGFSGEACTGGPDHIDGSSPLAPTTVGADVWYLQLASGCQREYAWMHRARATGEVGRATLPDSTIRATTDGQFLYSIVAHPPPPDPKMDITPDMRCATPEHPCTLERVALPDRFEPLPEPPALRTFG